MVKISTRNGKDLGKKMKQVGPEMNLTQNMGPKPAKASGKIPKNIKKSPTLNAPMSRNMFRG